MSESTVSSTAKGLLALEAAARGQENMHARLACLGSALVDQRTQLHRLQNAAAQQAADYVSKVASLEARLTDLAAEVTVLEARIDIMAGQHPAVRSEPIPTTKESE